MWVRPWATCVESCARAAPWIRMSATKAGSNLERKIVVLLIQSLRKIVVRLRLPLRHRGLGGAALGRLSTRAPATRALPADRNNLKAFDLGGVARLSFAIFP